MINHADEIASRPRKEWIKAKKEIDVAADNDKAEEVTKTPGMHRMTRKKRRRMEAKAVFDHFNSKDNEEAPSLPKPKKVKQPLHDSFDDTTKKKKKKDKKAKTEKSAFSAELGEQREKAEPPLGSKKMKEELIGGAYRFRGYDPDKKLGKKMGSKKFKSRAKFKRR